MDKIKRFLIGMPGKFDNKKFQRDFRSDFFGIEACMFNCEEDIKFLLEKADERNFKFGVHFPLHKNIFKHCRDPLFLSLDKKLSEESYSAFEEEIKYCKTISAEYLLVHFPKPVLIDTKLDWKFWRFANNLEWMDEEFYPYEKFKSRLEDMFKRLSELSYKYSVQIVLEHDAVSKYIYNTDLLETLLKKYSSLKICLDTGRLHLYEIVNPEFNSKEFTRKMAPYAYIVHLWNTNISNNSAGGHYPVLPRLKKDDGWGDIDSYLNIISSVNKDVKVLFEHKSELISDEELETCYKWVESFF